MSLDDNVALRHIGVMRLAEWRAREDKKQAPMAEAIGVTISQLSKIERGETFTSGETAERIKDYTGGEVTPNDLHDAWRDFQAERVAS